MGDLQGLIIVDSFDEEGGNTTNNYIVMSVEHKLATTHVQSTFYSGMNPFGKSLSDWFCFLKQMTSPLKTNEK